MSILQTYVVPKKASKKTKKPLTRYQFYGQQPNVVPHPLAIPLSKQMFCHQWRKNLTPLRAAFSPIIHKSKINGTIFNLLIYYSSLVQPLRRKSNTVSKGLKLLWLLYLFFILEVIIAVTLSRLKISIKQKLSPKESSSMNSPCGSLCFECSLFPNFIGIDFLITLQPEAFI